jgi:thiol-disulfide isomerase/thioredoxin
MAIGPFLVSYPRLFLALGIMIALLVAHVIERRTDSQVERPLWWVLLAGVLGARLAYAAGHLEHFSARPWEILYLWQGGYEALIGALISVGTALWFVLRRGYGYQRLGAPLLAGLTVWGTLAFASHALDKGTQNPLPDLQVRELGGDQISLTQFRGEPVVLNLWATWCPPCRREMPVLEEFQAKRSDVRFVFANQGEGASKVKRYLKEEALELNNVVLDPTSEVGRHFKTMGMPTTFFFNAHGERVDQHVGQIMRPQLRDYLEELEASS